MTTAPGPCTVEFGRLVDYLSNDLTIADADRLEDHLFECTSCAAKIESIERIGVAVVDAVRHAAVGANVNGAFLDRAARDGLTIREYRIRAGESVACSAGPEDLVLVRLAADFGDATDLSLDVRVHDLERGETAPTETRRIDADRDLGEVLMVFPGEAVRAFPRSRWTLRLRGDSPSGRTEIGRFVMDHTP